MIKRSAILVLSAVGIFLSGCGVSHMRIVKQSASMAKPQEVSLVRVEVVSDRQGVDKEDLSTAWEKLAVDELQSLLAQKLVKVRAGAHPTIVCRINVKFGNKALRYWVGFGAGTGSVDVVVEMKDANGQVIYATAAKANLSIGAFGGSMTAVVDGAIKSAVADFGSRL